MSQLASTDEGAFAGVSVSSDTTTPPVSADVEWPITTADRAAFKAGCEDRVKSRPSLLEHFNIVDPRQRRAYLLGFNDGKLLNSATRLHCGR